MSKLVIVVPKGRKFCGRSILFADDGERRAGPFRTLATASVRVAKKHGNAGASPLRPFGHPPEGAYVLAASLPPGFVHTRRKKRYGHVGGLLLAPQSGDALDATENGRDLVAVHGGPLDAKRRLRPTRGGIRFSNKGMTALLRAINAAQAAGDPLQTIELHEVEMTRKSKKDRKGRHRLRRKSSKSNKGSKSNKASKSSKSMTVAPMVLLPFGLGGLGKDGVVRRDVLRAVAIVAGTIALQACEVASPSCDPVACDPNDPSCPADGYVCGAGGYG